jgi:hypothetical protein
MGLYKHHYEHYNVSIKRTYWLFNILFYTIHINGNDLSNLMNQGALSSTNILGKDMANINNAIGKLKTSAVSVLFAIPCIALAGSGIIHDKLDRAEIGREVSSLQVVNFVKTKYSDKGRGVGFHKSPKEGFPDCYIVRLMTHEGIITILKINCQ